MLNLPFFIFKDFCIKIWTELVFSFKTINVHQIQIRRCVIWVYIEVWKIINIDSHSLSKCIDEAMQSCAFSVDKLEWRRLEKTNWKKHSEEKKTLHLQWSSSVSDDVVFMLTWWSNSHADGFFFIVRYKSCLITSNTHIRMIHYVDVEMYLPCNCVRMTD